jgi:hypothetical protein
VHVAAIPRQAGEKPQECSVAVNPRDPKNVIVSYQQAVGDGSDHYPDTRDDGHVAWSADGGKTWTIAPGTTDKRYQKWFDAMVTFDLHGHAFVAYIGMDQITMTTHEGEFVRRSLDGGRTWEAPITLIDHPGGHEKLMDHFPNIVADNDPGSPHAGSLYEVWDRILADGGEEIIFVRSTDDGKTWSAPRAISKHPVRLAHTMAVGHDGAIYVMYALEGGNEDEIWLEVSHDGGQTFDAPLPVTRTKANAIKSKVRYVDVNNFPRAGGWPLMAMDPRGSGRLFVVWGDFRNGDRDIFATTSTDGGHTWTPPVRVNDDPISNGRDQVMEWLAVDPTDGAAYVIFYDRRDDPKNLLPTVTLARSSDGGRTFTNYAWSTNTSDPTQATLGDYIGLAAQGGYVYGAWPENAPEAKGLPKREPRNFKIDEYETSDREWPFGPTIMRVGIADFRTAPSAKQ